MSVLDLPTRFLSQFRYLRQVRETRRKQFSSKRADEISQAALLDKRCREMWVWAISRAADDGISMGDAGDVCYHIVPWRYLSLAVRQGLIEIQTTFNDMDMSLSDDDCAWSESSYHDFSGLHRFHGSYRDGDSFSARDLEEDELSFIRDLLRKSEKEGGKTYGDCGGDTWRGRDSKHYARAGGDYLREDAEEWFSLEAFAKFSEWLGPVITTLSMMQNDWVAIDPVRVHGFVSKDKAKRQLMKTGLHGVFMLRFSVSNPGSIIINVTRKVSDFACIEKHLVNFTPN